MSKLAWNDVNWTLVHNRISRQQRRIYRASVEGNKAKVHAIQRKIILSLDARLLAIRHVTSENKKYNNIHVDRAQIISSKKKIELAYQLKLDGKIYFSNEIYKLKSKNRKSKFLNISIINDLAKQMLVKLALEPEWEAIIEPNSYGFGPGRSYHDAVANLFLTLRKKSKYVLNCDIQKCLDKINYDKLLKKISTFDLMENQIKAWLKANIVLTYKRRPDEVIQVIEKVSLTNILSPLLTNIALHGLEEHIKNWYMKTGYPTTKRNYSERKVDRIDFIRYAENLIIMSNTLLNLIEFEKQVEIWFNNDIGLELVNAKINIVHSTEGFEFLGFWIISIKQSSSYYKTRIFPSRRSKAQIIKCTREIIQANKSASSFSLISLLNHRILSWASYFCYFKESQHFSKIDYIIFNQVRAWVFRRRSKGLKSRTALRLKYFPKGKSYHFRGKNYNNNWILVGRSLTKTGKLRENFLLKMSWISSIPPVKNKKIASIYDKNY